MSAGGIREPAKCEVCGVVEEDEEVVARTWAACDDLHEHLDEPLFCPAHFDAPCPLAREHRDACPCPFCPGGHE